MAFEFIDEPSGRFEFVDDKPLTANPGAKQSILDRAADAYKAVQKGAVNLGAGGIRGAGSIGATLIRPFESAEDNAQRRQDIDGGLRELLGADPESFAYKTGKFGGEFFGTAGVGGVLAAPLRALSGTRLAAGFEPALEGVTRALQTGGFRAGPLAGTKVGAGVRVGAGAAVGGAGAGLVNPEEAGTGAVIGGALPGAAKVAGLAGNGIRNALVGQGASPEVAALANRAKELGIEIPADRLVNSRPLNAVASALNYVPFSGRAATEDAMTSQLNQALSGTFGQNSSNVTQALRKAGDELGAKFETVLKNNSVAVDQQFLTDLATASNRASRELGTDGAAIIGKQVDDIISKAESGLIDGQAAYNIKKTLDRIGQRNSPEAFYATDLKKSLMEALNRSLGPEKAAAFAQTRQQYGNMLQLEKLAKNGAEGEVSVARLANMRNINNPKMQELADIAAQFVKPRESQHSAAQRGFAGLGVAGLGFGGAGLPGAALGLGLSAGAGRATNAALNSNTLRNAVLQPRGLLTEPDSVGLLTNATYRSIPGLLDQ